MKITIVNACSDLGVEVNGSEKGPIALNKFEGIVDKVITINKKEVQKELEEGNLRRNIKYVNEFNKRLFNTILNEDNFVITVGGDHSIAIGSDLASRKKNGNIGIIWIDAHLDYNTFETTITGNLHGLPLAAINGLCSDLTEFTSDYINPKNTVVVGYRAMEENKEQEINNIKTSGGTIFTDEDIKKHGMDYVMEEALKIACNGTCGVHISYDLDSINPEICPGVSVPELGGLTLNEVDTAIKKINENIDKVKSFDLVEYNPDNAIDDKTLNIGLNILEKIIKAKE